MEEGEPTEVVLGDNSDVEHTVLSLPLWESDLGTEEEEGGVAVTEEIVQDKPTDEVSGFSVRPNFGFNIGGVLIFSLLLT